MGIAISQCELCNMPDVDIVRLSVRVAVLGKFSILDHNRAGWVGSGEDAFFVVVKVATAYHQICALMPNARAVVIGHRCASKLEVVDCCVAAQDYPDRLALRILACCFDPGASVNPD